MTPDLTSYDVILINTSGGKDSQAMMDLLMEQAQDLAVADRIVAIHCDLGRVEWPGTRELAERQARHYGIPFEVVSRPQGDLLVHIEQRGKWPSNTARYCTSDHKRGQVYRVMTQLVSQVLSRRAPEEPRRLVRILNCMGLRAEESPARSKRLPFSHDEDASNKTKRYVDEWLPIHAWTTAQVWERIRRSGVPHHYAYDLGLPRLSCVFCIFSPRLALLLAGEHNPELLAEYVRVERAINHKFREKQSIEEIQVALARGERGCAIDYWERCA